jgi:hypothetical protein
MNALFLVQQNVQIAYTTGVKLIMVTAVTTISLTPVIYLIQSSAKHNQLMQQGVK